MAERQIPIRQALIESKQIWLTNTMRQAMTDYGAESEKFLQVKTQIENDYNNYITNLRGIGFFRSEKKKMVDDWNRSISRAGKTYMAKNLQLLNKGDITENQMSREQSKIEQWMAGMYEYPKQGVIILAGIPIYTSKYTLSGGITQAQADSMNAETIATQLGVSKREYMHYTPERRQNLLDKYIVDGQIVIPGEVTWTETTIPRKPNESQAEYDTRLQKMVTAGKIRIKTTTVYTVKVTNPNTGKVWVQSFSGKNAEREANEYAAYQESTAGRIKARNEERGQDTTIVSPVVGTVQTDPNTVTYMGITMSRAQFEADFPPDTIPDSVIPDTPVSGQTYEEIMSATSDLLRENQALLEDASLKLAVEGKPWEGFMAWVGGRLYGARAVTYDTITGLIRPEVWKQTIQVMGYLLAPNEPETQAEFNNRIAELVEHDVADPKMREEVTELLQNTIPFVPVNQEYIDRAKEFRTALGKEIAREPVGFAIEFATSIYVGNLVGFALGGLYKTLTRKGINRQQLDKLRPLTEVDELTGRAFTQETQYMDDLLFGAETDYGLEGEIHVPDKFKEILDPEMFRGTDLQPLPDAPDGIWSADIITSGKTGFDKKFRSWEPDANKASWMKESVLDIAADVAAKGGQQVVFLRDPLTNKVAGVMSYADFIEATNNNPSAFAGMSAILVVTDAGGATDILDQAVNDHIFEEGLSYSTASADQILVSLDEQTINEIIESANRTNLKELEEKTLVTVIPILDLDVLTKTISKLDTETLVNTITKLDIDTITKVISIVDLSTKLDILQKLDTKTVTKILSKTDMKTLIAIVSKTDLTTKQFVALITQLDLTQIQIQELIQQTVQTQVQRQAIIQALIQEEVIKPKDPKIPRIPKPPKLEITKEKKPKKPTRFKVMFDYYTDREEFTVDAKSPGHAIYVADKRRKRKHMSIHAVVVEPR